MIRTLSHGKPLDSSDYSVTPDINENVATGSTRGWNNVSDMTLSILYGKSGLKDMNQVIT